MIALMVSVGYNSIMKRKDVIKDIVKILKTYEDCKLDKKCANEILTLLEILDYNRHNKK